MLAPAVAIGLGFAFMVTFLVELLEHDVAVTVSVTVAEPAPGKPTQPQSLVASEGVPHQEAVIAMAPPAPPAPLTPAMFKWPRWRRW